MARQTGAQRRAAQSKNRTNSGLSIGPGPRTRQGRPVGPKDGETKTKEGNLFRFDAKSKTWKLVNQPKPEAKLAAKPAAKPAVKPAAKPAAKPAVKPAAKPAAPAAAKPKPKPPANTTRSATVMRSPTGKEYAGPAFGERKAESKVGPIADGQKYSVQKTGKSVMQQQADELRKMGTKSESFKAEAEKARKESMAKSLKIKQEAEKKRRKGPRG
jgi:hypothetical protein